MRCLIAVEAYVCCLVAIEASGGSGGVEHFVVPPPLELIGRCVVRYCDVFSQAHGNVKLMSWL